MFDMTAPNTRQSNSTKIKGGHPQTPSSFASTVYRNEDGQAKDAWFREEEVMRRKLEKVAVNQLKSRIAQQNRAAGTGKGNERERPRDPDNDSDMDPNDLKPDHDAEVTNSAVNPGQVQLNSA